MNETKKMLGEEVELEFDALKEIEIGSEEYQKTVDGLTKLLDRQIKIAEVENERKDKDLEVRFKSNQVEQDRKDQLIKNCLTAAGISLPLVVTIWGTVMTFKFEEKGTISTTIGRAFVNKIIPKK